VASKSWINQEIIEPLASLDLRLEPSRALPTPRPNLGWVGRISIFRSNGRVGAARPIMAGYVVGFLQLAEALREHGFFRLQLLTEREVYMFVKRP